MDIKGLDLVQISQKLAIYVSEYFTGFTLAEGESLFAESYLFYFEEVKDSIPAQYNHLFNDESKFNGAAGFIEVNDKEHCIMMLTDEDYNHVYLLSKQDSDADGNESTVIIKDFMT